MIDSYVLSRRPSIRTLDSLLSPAEAAELAAFVQPSLNASGFVPVSNDHELITTLVSRIATALGTAPEAFEPTTAAIMSPGDSPATFAKLAEGRMLSVLVFLEAAEYGGALVFNDQPLRVGVEGKAGRAVVWATAAPIDGQPDLSTAHTIAAVSGGCSIVISIDAHFDDL